MFQFKSLSYKIDIRNSNSVIKVVHEGIIEGDQIEVAAFSLESFAYLTGLVTANHNADSNSARSHIANGQEA